LREAWLSPEEWDEEPPPLKRSSYTYEETRTSYLDVAPGIQLKVQAWVHGWADPGVRAADPGDSRPPEGDEEVEVTVVELHAFGRVLDLKDFWEVHADGDLDDAVDEALESI
jgi:hypothetical protein